MKRLLVVVFTGSPRLLLLPPPLKTATATYADHEKGCERRKRSSPRRILRSGAEPQGAGQVEVHEKETDIFYVTDGEATFITGGTNDRREDKPPNQLLGRIFREGRRIT